MAHEFLPTRDLARARRFRRLPTPAERKLWQALRADRLEGLAFRRQTPIGRYVVDFVSHHARLIVEVDGGPHFRLVRQRIDAQRDEWLRTRGYAVLRVLNDDVMSNLPGVLDLIVASADPSPQPSPARGEGDRGRHGRGRLPADVGVLESHR